ncbi:MAG: HPr family phosphocarrier protein [Eubacteriales bacterium]|nr:HPr family phosphocarrier protein [Eubacteriales bacterium]
MKTTTMFIKLQSIDKVKHFVNDVSKMQGDFDLTAGRYVINAKSIMGIFSLDLSKPLQLKISGAEEDDIVKLKKYC